MSVDFAHLDGDAAGAAGSSQDSHFSQADKPVDGDYDQRVRREHGGGQQQQQQRKLKNGIHEQEGDDVGFHDFEFMRNSRPDDDGGGEEGDTSGGVLGNLGRISPRITDGLVVELDNIDKSLPSEGPSKGRTKNKRRKHQQNRQYGGGAGQKRQRPAASGGRSDYLDRAYEQQRADARVSGGVQSSRYGGSGENRNGGASGGGGKMSSMDQKIPRKKSHASRGGGGGGGWIKRDDERSNSRGLRLPGDGNASTVSARQKKKRRAQLAHAAELRATLAGTGRDDDLEQSDGEEEVEQSFADFRSTKKRSRPPTNLQPTGRGNGQRGKKKASSKASSGGVVEILSSDEEGGAAGEVTPTKQGKKAKRKGGGGDGTWSEAAAQPAAAAPQAAECDDDHDDDDGEALVRRDDDADSGDGGGSPSSVVAAASPPPVRAGGAGKREARKERRRSSQGADESPRKSAPNGPSSDESGDAIRPSRGSAEKTTTSSSKARSVEGEEKASASSKEQPIHELSSDDESKDGGMDENSVPPKPSSSSSSKVSPKSPMDVLKSTAGIAAHLVADGASAVASAATSAFSSFSTTSKARTRKATPIRPGSTLSFNRTNDDIDEYSSAEEARKGHAAYRERREGAAKNKKKPKKKQQDGSGKNGQQTLGDSWRFGLTTTPSPREPSHGVTPSKFHSKRRTSRGQKKKQSASLGSRASPWNSSLRTSSSRRKSSRLSKKKNEVISIDDSSSESEGEAEFSMTEEEQLKIAKMNSLEDQHTPGRLRKFGERYKISAVRIAVGKKVFSHGCELSFQPSTNKPFLRLTFKAEPTSGTTSSATQSTSGKSGGAERSQAHTISLETITEMNFFLADDDDEGEGKDKVASSSVSDESLDSEPMSFLAMRVEPNDANKLSSYSNAYLQDLDKAKTKDWAQRKYLVIELRSNEAFKDMLDKMCSNETLGAFLDPSYQLGPQDVGAFNAALVEDDKKDRKNRLSSIGSSRKRATRSSSRAADASSSENKTLLVYPFQADESVFDNACENLRELGGQVVTREDDEHVWGPPAVVEQSSQSSSTDEVAVSNGRTHYLTIRSEDMDRLEPGEFLNDTLIDFFMRWIWRKEDPSDSQVHIFTSHFFTTLQEEGVEAVTTWTSKKNIDIFTKKFVFLPINESLHWSLCVVVNPGHIENEYLEEEEQQNTDICPCILFLDSLKAHRKARVAAKVRQWLNAEAKRLKKFPERNAPFQKTTMDVLDPKVPYQDNSWDCGVFVCRYAYSLFLLRNRDFTYEDCGDRAPWFRTAITDSPEFDFDMSDIARLRRELKTLVESLSESYKEAKGKEAAEKKRRKAEKAQKAQKAAEEKAAAEKEAKGSVDETVGETNNEDGTDSFKEDGSNCYV